VGWVIERALISWQSGRQKCPVTSQEPLGYLMLVLMVLDAQDCQDGNRLRGDRRACAMSPRRAMTSSRIIASENNAKRQVQFALSAFCFSVAMFLTLAPPKF